MTVGLEVFRNLYNWLNPDTNGIAKQSALERSETLDQYRRVTA